MKINQSIVTFQTKEWQEQLPLLPTQPSIGAVGVGSYVNYNGTYHKIGGNYALEVSLSATLAKRKSRFKSVQVVLTPQNSSADLSAIASRYNTSVQNNKLFIDVTEEVMASTETIVSFSLTGGSTAIDFFKTGVFAPYAIAIPLATEHPQTEISILDKASGKVALSSGKLVANIPLVSADSSLHGVGVGLVTSPIGTKLNLEETFDGDKYIPADGQEQTVYEQFFYLKDGKKVAIESNKVTINADGTYKTTILNEEYEVIREEFLSNGAKASTLPEKVKNCAFYETRSDELRQVQEQLKNHLQTAEDMLVWRYATSTNGESVPTAIYEVNDLSETAIKEIGSDLASGECYLSTIAEFMQIQNLDRQIRSLSSVYEETTDSDYLPDYLGNADFYYNSISLLHSIYELTQKINYYLTNYINSDDNTVIDTLVDRELVELSTIDAVNDGIYEPQSNSDLSSILGKDIKEMLRTRNAYIIQYENTVAERNSQIESLNSQVTYYQNLSSSHHDLLERISSEYFMLKNNETELIKNTPVSFISSGSMHKGYNQDGELILFFQSQECYVSVNRDKDGKILSLSDENGNAVLFKYDLKDNLEFIHDARGRIITISHPEDGKTEIVYPDGQVLTLTQTELTIGEDTEKVVSKVETFGITADVTYTDTGILSKITRIGANNTLIDEFSVNKTNNAISITNYDKSITKYTVEGEEITQKTVLINDVVTEMIKSSTYIADVGNFHVGKFLQTATKTSLYQTEDNVTFAVDGNGNPTDNYVKQEFDDFNKLIRKEEKAEGVTVTTDYTYDEDGLLIKETALYVKQDGEEMLETYTAVTEYSYNPSKAVIKKVSYVLGEELTNGKSIEEWIYDQNGILLKSFTYNSLDSSSKFYTEHIYDGKTHLADLDQTGEHKTEIEYVDKSSLVKTQKLPNGSKFSYGYDCADRLTAITQSTEEGEENSTSRVYENGLLKKLVSGDNVVTYTYTDDRRLETVSINGHEVVSYSHIEEDGKVIDKESGINGDITTTTNEFGEVVKKEDDFTRLDYVYDDYHRLKEFSSGCGYKAFEHNDDDTLKKVDSDTINESYEYDKFGKVVQKALEVNLNGTSSYTYDYSYSDCSKHIPQSVTVNNQLRVSQKTDALDRVTKKEYEFNNVPFANSRIVYLKKGDHATSIPSALYFDRIVNNKTVTDSLKYHYDKLGNVSKVYENGILKTRYAYDGVNRLIREDNRDLGKTYLFTYDDKGNIITKRIATFTLVNTDDIAEFVETVNYGYTEDKLTTYKDYAFSYDNGGKPEIYKNNSLFWIGSYLDSFNDTVRFKYESKSNRHMKCSSEKDITYAYDCTGKLVTQGNLDFIHAFGELIGVKYQGIFYYFRKNLQGDIIAILDSSGNVVVKYVYDAWGNHKVLDANGVEISDTTHVGHVNPIRYRGYYYDVETGLYYLQSRYYDPEVGRFVSPDSVDYLDPDSINGLNLYAYCGNNPVMNVDPTGHFWESLLNGLKALWNAVVGWVKETVGTFISTTFNEHSMNNDFILFGVESGFSNTLLVQGEEKPISFFATNPSEWYKFWEYTIGISINIGKFSYSTTLGIGSHNGSIGWNGYNYDFELSVEKFSLGFSRTVENTTSYSNVYIRPLILLLACMPIPNMFQPAY